MLLTESNRTTSDHDNWPASHIFAMCDVHVVLRLDGLYKMNMQKGYLPSFYI